MTSDTIRNRLAGIAIVISLIALGVAGWSAYEGKRKADVAVDQFNLNVAAEKKKEDADRQLVQQWKDSAEKSRVLDFQTYKIHEIVDEWDTTTGTGISFDQIKSEFLQTVAQDGTIPKEAIQDDQLRRILLNLKTSGLVYQTTDGSYATQRNELAFGFGRGYAMDKASQGMLEHLTVTGPKNNTELLSYTNENYKLTPDEYYLTLATLKKEGLVMFGEGKVWSIISLAGKSPVQPASATLPVPDP
jgi:hypothetical protein